MVPSTRVLRVAGLMAISSLASSFTAVVQPARSLISRTMLRESYPGVDFSGNSKGSAGSIEQIEFKIYADGRVEETVRGIKGGNCHKVTEKINEALGKVVQSAPTEELYEQEVVLDQTLVQTEGTSWDGSTPNSW